MAARTGEQFLRGLKGAREIWIGADKVSDVTEHPAFAGAAQGLAGVFDLQHQYADDCLMPDPETGEPINVSHMIPRSKEDLLKRHKGLQRTAEYTVGVLGRSPDYMNVTYAGFAGRSDEWSANGNEEGAENLVNYQKFMRRNDLSLTHTIIHPTIDKAGGDIVGPPNEVPLHKAAHQFQPLRGVQFVRQCHVELAGKLGVLALLHALDGAPQQFPVLQPCGGADRHHDFRMGDPAPAAVIVDFACVIVTNLRPAAVGRRRRRLRRRAKTSVRILLGLAAQNLP